MAQAAIAWLLLGIVSAAAGSAGRYAAYDHGVYLPYVNAPGPSDGKRSMFGILSADTTTPVEPVSMTAS